MELWDLNLHGLGAISVGEVMVERNSDLSEVRAGVMVSVDKLLLSGEPDYAMQRTKNKASCIKKELCYAMRMC